MKISEIGELGLIARLAKKLGKGPSVVVGVGDDAAALRWTKDKYLLFASDMLVEGVHFTRSRATPFQIGWKALAVNISDIAAMGGVPLYAVSSIGIDPALPVSFADGIYRGMATLAKRFGVSIVGGDTNASKRLVVDVAILGEVERPRMATRSGARQGDVILVTGSLGGSIKGKHLTFLPRVREARHLVSRYAVHSMIDISDGLILDLSRVLDASSCGAVIYENCIPLSREASSFEAAVRDGEDFELLFTMGPKEARRFFKKDFARFGTEVSLIGEIVERRKGLRLLDRSGRVRKLKRGGYTHF